MEYHSQNKVEEHIRPLRTIRPQCLSGTCDDANTPDVRLTTTTATTNNNNNNNTATFPQSGSSSAGIQLISASDIGQAISNGEIPYFF